MKLSDSELEILLDLIDEEPAKHLVEKLFSGLCDGSILDDWLEERLLFGLSRADEKLRPGLLASLALHAITSDKWSLVPAPTDLSSDDINGVLRGIDGFRWQGDPGSEIWDWLDLLQATEPSKRYSIYCTIASGVEAGWQIDRRLDEFLAALELKPEGRGMSRKDIARVAAGTFLACLQTKNQRDKVLPHLKELASNGKGQPRALAIWCLAADAGYRNQWQEVEPLVAKSKDMAAAVDGIDSTIHHHCRSNETPELAAGALPVLYCVLRDGSQAARKDAIHALWVMSYWGKLDVTEALPEIERALSEDKLRVDAMKLVAAMANLDQPAVAHLREKIEPFADDKNRLVRAAASNALFALRERKS